MRQFALIVLLSLLTLSLPVAPAQTPPESCEEAVERVRAHLETNRREYDFNSGLSYALEELRTPCAIDAESLMTRAQDTEIEERGCGDDGCATLPVDNPPFAPTSVPCSESGAGSGIMTSYVLGVELERDDGAAGSWTGGNGIVTVNGESVKVSGKQTARTGTIWPLHLLPLPADDGHTGATCAWVKNDIGAHRENKCYYWWVIFAGGYKCTDTTDAEVELTLEPCTGFASQHTVLLNDFTRPIGGVNLASATHSYAADPNPCELAGQAKLRLG